jgi:phage tail-like protein
VTTAINSALRLGVGAASAQAMSAGKISQTGLGTQPKLGMSMWFDVIVHDTDMEQGGDQMLGDWASCSGLNVKFNIEPLDEGGEYDSPWHMPTKITYGEITLERAMVKETSARVEKWLTQVAANWMNGDDGGAKDRSMAVGTTVVIALRSSLGVGKQGDDNLVHMWTLKDAIPVGWSGPTLSAKGNEIATEKLTIAHRGFLTSKPGAGSATKSDKAEQGKLKLSYEGKDVTFPYNPKTVTLDKMITIDEGKIQGLEPQVTDSGKLSLKFSALRVEGATAIKANIDTLWGWLDPIPIPAAPATPATETAVASGAAASTPEPAAPAGASADADGKKKDKKKKKALGTPKKLELKLGSALAYTVLLRQVNANYTRFNKNGEPTRADVTLTLQVEEVPPPSTNPSSGGRPGGQLHTAIAGDTLPAIATATYGDPGAWRDIAQDNGIDDPMRMKPGRTLYLAGA